MPVLKLINLPANGLLLSCILRLFDIFSCKIAGKEVTLMSPLNKECPWISNCDIDLSLHFLIESVTLKLNSRKFIKFVIFYIMDVKSKKGNYKEHDD